MYIYIFIYIHSFLAESNSQVFFRLPEIVMIHSDLSLADCHRATGDLELCLGHPFQTRGLGPWKCSEATGDPSVFFFFGGYNM